MYKELQDNLWGCLPKEIRDRIREEYKDNNSSMKWYKEGFFDAMDKIFHHNNITSDIEPEEMLIVERKKVQEVFGPKLSKLSADYQRGARNTLKYLFGNKCLLDKELNEHNFAKSDKKKKYKIGDRIKVIEGKYKTLSGIIKKYSEDDNTWVITLCNFDYPIHFDEEWIEPYTKEKSDMEEKELNLYELLKGCEREEFYSPTFGKIKFVEFINRTCLFTVVNADDIEIILLHNGKWCSDSKVISVFPSEKLYEKYPFDAYLAWMEWKDNYKSRFRYGEEYYSISGTGEVIKLKYLGNEIDVTLAKFHNQFKTEERAKRAAEKVCRCLEEFHIKENNGKI